LRQCSASLARGLERLTRLYPHWASVQKVRHDAAHGSASRSSSGRQRVTDGLTLSQLQLL
jgi:hypothetical protein